MLVLSREAGTSIVIGDFCVLTVLKVFRDRRVISLLITQANATSPGVLDSRSTDIELGGRLKISDNLDVTFVDLRDDKARIGINFPPELSVHRLEIYKVIRRVNRREDDHPDDGGARSRVPWPFSPKPPSLDIRLDEPQSPDEDAE
jgi:carbon storage regulator CsrA